MAHKVKNLIEDKHLKTNIHQIKCEQCSECPLHVYSNDNDVVIFGVGNIFADTILVLPSYDTKAKVNYTTILSIVEKAYYQIEHKDIYEECYVTRTIKCYDKSNYNLMQDAIKHCKEFLYYEVIKLKPRRIIIFDSKFDTTELEMNTFARIAHVINPGVMYYDNNKLKQTFMKQFKEALYDT